MNRPTLKLFEIPNTGRVSNHDAFAAFVNATEVIRQIDFESIWNMPREGRQRLRQLTDCVLAQHDMPQSTLIATEAIREELMALDWFHSN